MMTKFIKDHRTQAEEFFTILKEIYTKAYRGFSKIFASVYFSLAFIFAFLMHGEWLYNTEWITSIKTIIPSLLGFSLAAYTLLSTFGDDEFRKFISTKDQTNKNETLYMQANGAFVHFIIIQLISLFLALIGKTVILQSNTTYNVEPSYLQKIFSWFSVFIFAYALLLCLATIINIYRIARVYQQYNNCRYKK